MGRDKALLEVDGQPLWVRQRDLLVAAGAREIFLSARPEQAWAQRVTGFAAVVHDALPGGGPLVGITAALERAQHPWVAALAIDLPAMQAAWFLERSKDLSERHGVVGRRGGFFEPLAAIYPRDVKWLAWAALARGEYSLQRLIASAVQEGLLRVHEIAPADEPLFANWNA